MAQTRSRLAQGFVRFAEGEAGQMRAIARAVVEGAGGDGGDASLCGKMPAKPNIIPKS